MQGKDVDWHQINQKLPVGQTPEDLEKRRKMFNEFDTNGNGYLSLAEIDKGIRDVLCSDSVFDCKNSIIRAFQAAKNSVKLKSSVGGDYIEKSEFRYFLLYLRQYFEYWVIFSQIDKSGNKRIEISEFLKAIPIMERWGVKLPDPKAIFNLIDKNGSGFILFDEFSEYAIKASLDLEDNEDMASDFMQLY